jgi:uncharacterized membrane protein YuzA (DUF378 family)
MKSKSIKLHMFLMALVIIGSINWGTTALGYNIVEHLSNYINILFKTTLHLDKIIYLLVAISAILLASKRDTWLPFLGISVLPDAIIPLSHPTPTDKIIKIKTLPNVKIAYWAALNKGDKTPVIVAYNNYENSGVVMSDENGNASFPILTGSGYTLPSGKVLSRHLHYRIIGNSENKGMMNRIETINY